MPELHTTRSALNWPNCFNARDVGGYPTAEGGQVRSRVLLRSDNLNRLSDEGRAALLADGVRTIIDLRSAYELDSDPNPFAASHGNGEAPAYLHLPVLSEAGESGDPALSGAGTMLDKNLVIVDNYSRNIAAIVKAVAAAEQRGGVLVHCHAGKDRTGLIVALLLSLVEVPRDVIAQDYTASSIYLQSVYDTWLGEKPRTPEEIASFEGWFLSPAETILDTLDHLEHKYGGVAHYLMSEGVTQDNIVAIKTRLTQS